MFDPYDQSLWFYHQNLMCAFDPCMAAQSITPGLSDSHRLKYLAEELDFIQGLLDGADDCKWIYQALIQYNLLVSQIRGSTSVQDRQNFTKWLAELKHLDPLRRGRWVDLETSLAT